MTTHRLIAANGNLHFPNPAAPKARGHLLVYRYAAGDIDTCPWPMVGDEYATEDELKARLACALFDEREMNDHFKYGDQVELPDGTLFDFDLLVR